MPTSEEQFDEQVRKFHFGVGTIYAKYVAFTKGWRMPLDVEACPCVRVMSFLNNLGPEGVEANWDRCVKICRWSARSWFKYHEKDGYLEMVFLSAAAYPAIPKVLRWAVDEAKKYNPVTHERVA